LRFNVVLDNKGDSKLRYVLGGTQKLKDSIFSFWQQHAIKHSPAIHDGRLWESIYEFVVTLDDTKKTTVKNTGYAVIGGLAIHNGMMYIIHDSKLANSVFQLIYDDKNTLDKIYTDNHFDSLAIDDKEGTFKVNG